MLQAAPWHLIYQPMRAAKVQAWRSAKPEPAMDRDERTGRGAPSVAPSTERVRISLILAASASGRFCGPFSRLPGGRPMPGFYLAMAERRASWPPTFTRWPRVPPRQQRCRGSGGRMT